MQIFDFFDIYKPCKEPDFEASKWNWYPNKSTKPYVVQALNKRRQEKPRSNPNVSFCL